MCFVLVLLSAERIKEIDQAFLQVWSIGAAAEPSDMVRDTAQGTAMVVWQSAFQIENQRNIPPTSESWHPLNFSIGLKSTLFTKLRTDTTEILFP